ncbi:hypothetical protein PPERSA_04503 [Pseudocohnilembus persalinus]|uniref:F-box/LRR-repeat protein 15-like leucin rich repeat domain-containing protein n=1 Tax=Pseudocohnilembus persalinus TaxID=266149 RepID=A0A0V0QTZ6_PSEPJ|nr:hypothetical protein PPERSA_04503 [Pseudocohnilembus persalinus]|eukprot:KRX05466.1 hypothetical protein PPERSA_04503 [Pseudocohnilembus persalinus]
MLHQDKQYSIKETVDRNIEKNQFPHYRNHKSLIGWCTMNYPKVLQNPKLIPKPQPRGDDYYDRKQDELKYLYQKRTFEMRQGTNFDYKKPFQTFSKYNQAQREEKVGIPPDGFKNSSLSLTTVPKPIRKQIIDEQNKDAKFVSFLPISNEVGKTHYNEDYSRRIRQIGEISYKPKYESEEHRHYKKLSNNVLTEQNMMEIMDDNLTYLNLHNHTWIPNELISKIGYFAKNIQEIDLSETDITDDVIKELALSCPRLRAINISRCRNLTSQGIQFFLEKKANNLTKFESSYNLIQINDQILSPLKKASHLLVLDLSFCKDITDETLAYIQDSEASLEQLKLSGCENIKNQYLIQIIQNSRQSLTHIDLSQCPQKEIGKEVCKILGTCTKLQEIVFTGSANILDDGIQALTSYDDPKFKSLGFTDLKTVKLGGLEQISETTLGKLFQMSPALQTVELNNVEKISEYTLAQITKNCQNIKTVLLNFTPNLVEKKWENLSSDDEEEVQHEQQHVQQEQQKEEPKAQTEEQTEETQQDQQEKKPYQQNQEKRLSLYEQKAQIIDEIKKQSGKKVAINIHKVDFNANIEDIKNNFKDVNISRIYKEDRPGMFTLEFDNPQDGIHFAKVAPRPINGRKFFIRLSNKIRKDNNEWNQIGAGGKIINKPRYNKNFNSYNTQQGSRPQGRTYNKRENETEGEKPQNQEEDKQEQQQQERPRRTENHEGKTFEQKPRPTYEQRKEGQEQTHYKKPYQNKYSNNNEQKSGDDSERPSYQKRGFHKGGSNSGKQQNDNKDQGFTRSNKGQNTQQQQKPKTQEKPADDGWQTAK